MTENLTKEERINDDGLRNLSELPDREDWLIRRLARELLALRDEVERLRAALEFYSRLEAGEHLRAVQAEERERCARIVGELRSVDAGDPARYRHPDHALSAAVSAIRSAK